MRGQVEKWEYSVISMYYEVGVGWMAGHDQMSVNEVLAKAGNDGWELVSVVPSDWEPSRGLIPTHDPKYTWSGYQLFLKRRQP